MHIGSNLNFWQFSTQTPAILHKKYSENNFNAASLVYGPQFKNLTSMCKFGPNMCSTTLLWISQSASSFAIELQRWSRTRRRRLKAKSQHEEPQNISTHEAHTFPVSFIPCFHYNTGRQTPKMTQTQCEHYWSQQKRHSMRININQRECGASQACFQTDLLLQMKWKMSQDRHTFLCRTPGTRCCRRHWRCGADSEETHTKTIKFKYFAMELSLGAAVSEEVLAPLNMWASLRTYEVIIRMHSKCPLQLAWTCQLSIQITRLHVNIKGVSVSERRS